VTNGGDPVPTTALASIFVNTGQSQHTLTATFGAYHQRRKYGGPTGDESIT